MKKRLPTSIAILIVTIGFVLLRQFSLLFFDALVLSIMLGSIIEMVKANKKHHKKVDVGLLLIIPIVECLIFNLTTGKSIVLYNIALVIFAILYLLTVEIILYARNRKNNIEQDANEINAHLFDRTKNTLLLCAYPILPLVFMLVLNHIGYELGYMAIVLMFTVAMMTDTFAYLIGCGFGKRKFIPEVSPKKSIAGVVGGFIGGIIGVVLVYVFFYFTNWFSILNVTDLTTSILAFAFIGLIGSYANQLGDLIASAYKRKVEIKDFSNIFPGHGGFMDRVDGMMFVSCVVFVALSLFFV